MHQSPDDFSTTRELEVLADPTFRQQVQRLHELTVYGRWAIVLLLWLTLGPFSLWALRHEMGLWHESFTWVAVRYGLADHYGATLGLAFCVGMTVATLIWQSRNIIWGLPKRDRRCLENQVLQIRRQGQSHPLWRWVCRL
ncbi:hypothetical protein DO97_02860 [Neosynechococcus sphagnicola sy1]|uniref:Poly-beta-1,6-N-acetyl-D-glucosamine biosynthesis protein PgaD n=1 Tax=Neosynechococcus sphagnicola sy1 TaxID=1497020 RepID=A0A098TL36_9CYAN|nr:hypothetical protein [Neosynechococcus sphagnicola]KGF73004.1 hypothetical protein DO97_02860 [Neosynechococcus sphagnicola sy1]